MYVSSHHPLLVTPHHETAAASLTSKDDASAELISSSSSSSSSFEPSNSTFIITHHHRHPEMTQTRDHQHPAPLAPFPTLPSQVSSASSLNSNASSNASTLMSLQNHAASAQLGMPATASPNTSLGLLASNFTNSIMNNPTNPNYNATAAALASASIVSGTVPEFLYQLTKMLTDPNNEIIEWSTYSGNGRIEVHNPSRLESEVLSRYFRHSKYSSFQRQLNYFGFRKIAGKGKMSPCSYVNDAATLDIRSLLLMKRKGGEKEKSGCNKTAADVGNSDDGNSNASAPSSVQVGSKRLNPGNDIQPATIQPMFHNAHRNISFDTMAATVAKNIADSRSQQQQQQLQKHNEEFSEFKRTKLESSTSAPSSSDGRGYTVAQGKGIRHQLNGYLRPSSSGGSINITSPAVVDGESSSNQTLTWSVPHTTSNMAHTTGSSASTAPLQFLDPNELGMSVTSATYLNQLKNNFAAVADATTVGTASTEGNNQGYAVNQQRTPENSSSTSYNNHNASVSRVSSQASFLGMLHRDDSLINLAMLPILDTNTATGINNSDNSTSNIDGEVTFGFIDYNPSS